MRYDELSLLARKVIEKAGLISDPLEYLNNSDFDTTTDLSSFKKSIDELHGSIIKVISVPLNSRNQSSP